MCVCACGWVGGLVGAMSHASVHVHVLGGRIACVCVCMCMCICVCVYVYVCARVQIRRLGRIAWSKHQLSA